MGSQMESSPSHGHGINNSHPSSTTAPDERHETDTRSNGGMTRWEGTVGMSPQNPLPIFTGTKPSLLHRDLGPGSADESAERGTDTSRHNSCEQDPHPSTSLPLLPPDSEPKDQT